MKELLVNINSLSPELFTSAISDLTILQEQIDKFGFIVMSKEQRYERHKFLLRMRYLKGGSTIGQYNQCKDLCKYLPRKKKMPNSLQMIPGTYWCKECECIMNCSRCLCCGNLGRSKARNRKRDNEKRID